jgi:hypothetical protein
MPSIIGRDPRVGLVIDTCELGTGEVLQVIATGHAELCPYDIERGFRTLSRYLGDDESTWDDHFRRYLYGVSEVQWLRWSRQASAPATSRFGRRTMTLVRSGLRHNCRSALADQYRSGHVRFLPVSSAAATRLRESEREHLVHTNALAVLCDSCNVVPYSDRWSGG